MRRSFLLPLTLVSGLLLSACGTRTSLTAPVDTKCGPWSVGDGTAGVQRRAWAPFAVRDDGSVVLPIEDLVQGTGGGGNQDSATYRVRKIDANGQLAWDEMGGPGARLLIAVSRDAADGLVVLGALAPGMQSVLGATLSCPENEICTFVGKLAATGTLTWSKVVSSNQAGAAVWPQDLAVTGDGRMTVEGTFVGAVDFGCGPLTASEGLTNRYLAQLSPSGECLWSRAIVGSAQFETGSDKIAVGDDGEVALALPLLSDGTPTIDLGGGPVPFDTETAPGFAVAKYTPNGDLVFAKVVSGGTGAAWTNVAVIGAGEVLLSTHYEGTLDLGGGPRGAPGTVRHFVTRLGAKGEELWTRDIAAGPPDGRQPFAFAVEPSGGFFLAGSGAPGMTILGEPTLPTALFVAAYDAGGEPVDVQTFPFTGDASVVGLSASSAGALVLDGVFAGTLDFGQDSLVSAGVADTFVARICR